MASLMSPSASTWTVTESHPASAKAPMYLAGSWIMRCASKGRSVHGLTALITGGPNVIFGTNMPSITSRWTQSAPEYSTRATSSPSLEKSAERIDGDTRVMPALLPCGFKGFPSLKVASERTIGQ